MKEKVKSFDNYISLREELLRLKKKTCSHGGDLINKYMYCFLDDKTPKFCKQYKDNAYVFYKTALKAEHFSDNFIKSLCTCDPDIITHGIDLEKYHEPDCKHTINANTGHQFFNIAKDKSDFQSINWKIKGNLTPLARDNIKILAKGSHCIHKYNKSDCNINTFDIDEPGLSHYSFCEEYKYIVNGKKSKVSEPSSQSVRTSEIGTWDSVGSVTTDSGSTNIHIDGSWTITDTDTSGALTGSTNAVYYTEAKTEERTEKTGTTPIKEKPKGKRVLTINVTKIKKTIYNNSKDIIKISIGVILALTFISFLA